jgi:DNA ligase-4
MISSNIRIWSKSGRESTWDRLGVHGIVRDALGLNNVGRRGRRVGGKFDFPSSMMRAKRNVVLDAEMVAWYKDHVDGLCFVFPFLWFCGGLCS